MAASPSVGSDQDASAQRIDWLIASLPAGQTVTLTVTYHVATGTNSATVDNTATAVSTQVTSVNDSDDVQVVENVRLTIAKDFSNPPNDAAGDTREETVTAGEFVWLSLAR